MIPFSGFYQTIIFSTEITMNNRKQGQKVLHIFSGVSLQKCLSSLMVVLLSLGATTVSAIRFSGLPVGHYHKSQYRYR
jgi:hypothetical protein